jgi:methylmalonyl-CoA mutase cobalamin-binding domain/chain
MQQILAYETDLLDYDDVFAGSPAIAAKVAELVREAKLELAHIEGLGGAVAAVEQGYMKQQLVESNTRRVEAIERGERIVVGVNKFIETEPSPLVDAAEAILTVSPQAEAEQIERLKVWRADVDRVSRRLGRRLKLVVGKPGLDGHSNGAEQIAARARDSGMDVTYAGIRLTPAEIVSAALAEGAHVVGLSILSGSHSPLVKEVLARMREAGLTDVPVVVGGIIPPDDASELKAEGVAAVYTPKDFQINHIMADLVRIVDATRR